MRVIRPTIITAEMLVDSTAPDAALPDWASGTGYAQGAQVVRDRRIWESLPSGTNTGHDPLTDAAAEYWRFVGPTNPWAMFDQAAGTLTEGTGEIIVEIEPGSVDTIALLDLTAETVTVEMTESSTVVFSETRNTNIAGTSIDSYFAWFFEPPGRRRSMLFEVPPYSTASITVTIEGIDGAAPVSVGTMVVGRKFELGSTERAPRVGIIDYSVKVVDQFAAARVVERPFIKRATMRAFLASAQVDAVQDELARLRATPCLWIGDDGSDSLALYGFYKDFDLVIEPPNATLDITVESLSSLN